ncbi:MAG: hypothetical protein MUQ56_03795 [Thermoleophilia bacterium]|nr:hypothetical protein [Thermoleophilia bacterium]
MLSPLQLDDFALEHLTISRGKLPTRSTKLPEEIGYSIKADYGLKKLRRTGGRPRYSVSLEFQLESQEEDQFAPVRVVLAGVTGTFSFAVDTPKELLEQLVPANCLAILYGILRGIVIQATSGCSGGCFILPSLSIHYLIALKESGDELAETVTALTGRPNAKSRPKAKKRARKKKS